MLDKKYLPFKRNENFYLTGFYVAKNFHYSCKTSFLSKFEQKKAEFFDIFLPQSFKLGKQNKDKESS